MWVQNFELIKYIKDRWLRGSVGIVKKEFKILNPYGRPKYRQEAVSAVRFAEGFKIVNAPAVKRAEMPLAWTQPAKA
jgi:hypothetical protein